MRRWMISISSRGQVTVETAVLYGAVIAALVGVALYVKGGAAGGARGNADSLGTQFRTDQKFESRSISVTEDNGDTVGTGQSSKQCQGINDATPDCTPDEPDDPLP